MIFIIENTDGKRMRLYRMNDGSGAIVVEIDSEAAFVIEEADVQGVVKAIDCLSY